MTFPVYTRPQFLQEINRLAPQSAPRASFNRQIVQVADRALGSLQHLPSDPILQTAQRHLNDELIRALDKQDLDQVKLALKKGADVHSKRSGDPLGLSALHLAALRGNLEILKVCLEVKGADVNIQDNDGCTPMHRAIEHSKMDIIDYLLTQPNVDLKKTDHHGFHPMTMAIETGKFEIFRKLFRSVSPQFFDQVEIAQLIFFALQYNRKNIFDYLTAFKQIEINKDFEVFRDKKGHNLLHLAVIKGNLPLVRFLIEEKSFDINAQSNRGYTPLELAIDYGHNEVVDYLLTQESLDLEVTNVTNETPLLFAITHDLYITKKLLERSNLKRLFSDKEFTYLQYAAFKGRLSIVKTLLATQEFDVDYRNKKGDTALIIAIDHGHTEIARYLILEGGASTQLTYKDYGDSVLSIFFRGPNVSNAENPNASIAIDGETEEEKAKRLLLKEKNLAIKNCILELLDLDAFDYNQTSLDQKTLLHWVVRKNEDEMAEKLIRKKALVDVNAVDNEGNTPLILALENAKYHGGREKSERIIHSLLKREDIDLSHRTPQRVETFFDEQEESNILVLGRFSMFYLMLKGSHIDALEQAIEKGLINYKNLKETYSNIKKYSVLNPTVHRYDPEILEVLTHLFLDPKVSWDEFGKEFKSICLAWKMIQVESPQTLKELALKFLNAASNNDQFIPFFTSLFACLPNSIKKAMALGASSSQVFRELERKDPAFRREIDTTLELNPAQELAVVEVVPLINALD